MTKSRSNWQRCEYVNGIGKDIGDYSRMKQMMLDVGNHGEVHATVEEHDSEFEVRLGTAEWDFGAELLSIEGYDTTTRVPFDKIVSWYKPMERTH